MGCSSSCNIFETFSTALEWIAMNKLNASAVIHILDDFLFIAPSKEISVWGNCKEAKLGSLEKIHLSAAKLIFSNNGYHALGNQ